MSTLAADIDPAVEDAIRRCLDPEPTRRPASALAVSAALPGGDPLAAALAAGETPSPEMVAQSGRTEGLARRYSVPCLLVIFACLFAGTAARDKTYSMLRTPLEMSPDVLAQKSREVAASFGYTRKPGDSEIRLDHRRPLLGYLNRQPEPRKWNEWLGDEAPISSTYREALGIWTAPALGRPEDREDVPASMDWCPCDLAWCKSDWKAGESFVSSTEFLMSTRR
jgi:serine/threonine-protein kinase